ncbi:hypothetical protein V7S43_002541 [Phytophthora oleae]|uniref:PiggyBac transposable element-derived protein domain-containing protein n=1 Tax=Phytophthora oleae TaxID=2107226 RepID=A0ABD3FYP6_9STRA
MLQWGGLIHCQARLGLSISIRTDYGATPGGDTRQKTITPAGLRDLLTRNRCGTSLLANTGAKSNRPSRMTHFAGGPRKRRRHCLAFYIGWSHQLCYCFLQPKARLKGKWTGTMLS